MKKLTTTLLFLLGLQTALAQILSPTPLQHGDIDYGRLAQVDVLLQEYLERQWLVGAVVLVAKDNQIIYHKGHGLADRSSKTPMRPAAIFRIMSQTKAIT